MVTLWAGFSPCIVAHREGTGRDQYEIQLHSAAQVHRKFLRRLLRLAESSPRHCEKHQAPNRELWQAAQVLEAAAGNEWGRSFSMDHDGGHTEMESFIEPIGDAACQKMVEELEGLIEDVLTEIYEDACHRLKKIGNDEIEYQSSDEYIGELLENNPHFLFDEDGEPA